MKQHRFIFGTIVTVAFILAGISACSIDEPQLQNGLRRVSIKATIENDGPGTKVTIADGDPGQEGEFKWNKDDALAVYVEENGVGTLRITEPCVPDTDNPAVGDFDLYMSEDATRTGVAFYPASSVGGGDGVSMENPGFDPGDPKVFLPYYINHADYIDGQREHHYSPMPMIAVNTEGDNLQFRHLGGLIRLDFAENNNYSVYSVLSFKVAVGIMVGNEFRARRITGVFDVINPNATDINNGNCYIQTDENNYKTGNDIWSWRNGYNIDIRPLFTNPQTLNIPVPTGHYDAIVIRNQKNSTTGYTEFLYTLGPDGWTCQRRHAKKLSVVVDPVNTEYYLDKPQTVELPYNGGTASLHADQLFKSYKVVPKPTSVDPDATESRPVPYHLEYSEDGTNWSTTAPDWLTANSPSSFAGSVEGEDLTLTMEAQDNSTPDSHAATLRGKAELADFDLSTINVATGETCTMTTANCYVVQAPGSYKIPLVYGNGVVNGAVNEDAFRGRAGVGGAYRPDAGDEARIGSTAYGWYMGRFKDHLDQNITSPYIATQLAGKNLTATVIWTDAKNLVTDAAISGSGNSAYLTFDVPKDYICQGNALVAVLADGVIAWSWHIWVTDENLTFLKDGCNGYKFTNVNLGWCDGRTETYAERTCQVRAVQDAPGVTAENQLVKGPVTIRQTANTVTTLGNDVLYQWGRKDPLQGGDGSSQTAFKVFYADNYAPEIAAGKVSLGTAIQNPYKFYTNGGSGYYDWCSTPYYNNWNAALNACNSDTKSVPVTKTIYDPTPVGFKMPPQAAFDGFSTDNFTTVTKDGNNGRIYNGTLFFPAAGQRDYLSGTLQNVGKNGYYWTASSLYQNYAYSLLYKLVDGVENDVSPAYTALRGRARSIRPAVEWNVTGENLIQWD